MVCHVAQPPKPAGSQLKQTPHTFDLKHVCQLRFCRLISIEDGARCRKHKNRPKRLLTRVPRYTIPLHQNDSQAPNRTRSRWLKRPHKLQTTRRVNETLFFSTAPKKEGSIIRISVGYTVYRIESFDVHTIRIEICNIRYVLCITERALPPISWRTGGVLGCTISIAVAGGGPAFYRTNGLLSRIK